MKHWVRFYQKLDFSKAEKKLLVVGAYKAECFNCHNIDLDKNADVCPYCGTKFEYAGFREKRVLPAELERCWQRGLKILDWQDFSSAYKRQKARKILGD